MSAAKPTVGVSACLMGEPVRYDGGDKRNAVVMDELSRYFAFLPLCPEVAIGLGVPRKPIQLVADGADGVRVLGVEDEDLDVTQPLSDYAHAQARSLPRISGFIFKAGSPSCGLEDVRVKQPDGSFRAGGRGRFAHAFLQEHPGLPAIDESRLQDPDLRRGFLQRVFARQAALSMIL